MARNVSAPMTGFENRMIGDAAIGAGGTFAAAAGNWTGHEIVSIIVALGSIATLANRVWVTRRKPRKKTRHPSEHVPK